MLCTLPLKLPRPVHQAASLRSHQHPPAAFSGVVLNQRLTRRHRNSLTIHIVEVKYFAAVEESDTDLQPPVHELLGLHILLKQAVAQDERIPQLQLLKQGHGRAHQPSRDQLLAQLLAQGWAHREPHTEGMPAAESIYLEWLHRI